MRTLAIETTDLSGSVAALQADRVVASLDLDPTQRSAVALAPAMVELMATAGWQPADVQMVAVATGPGSFTGLRVGVATAKMFAYAVGAAVMGVNTLEAIAWQATADVHDLWAVLDAQRNQVFAGHFSRSAAGEWQWLGETRLLDDAAWLAELSPNTTVSGPGLKKLRKKIPDGVQVIDESLWRPHATTIGKLAGRQHLRGRRDDLWSLVPQYFRRSAAEEKRDAQKRT